MKSKYLRTRILLIAIMFLFATSGITLKSQITHFEGSGVYRQYEKAEFDIFINAAWTDPFSSAVIALDMILTSPTGKNLVLPCYYSSGESGSESKWKARFMAQETGTYNYKFRLTINGKVTDESESSSFKSVKSSGKGILRPNNYWTFKFDNGEVFRGIGENIGWDPRNNDNQKYNYEYMLKVLADNGGNYFRCWMNSNTLPVDWKTTRNPNVTIIPAQDSMKVV